MRANRATFVYTPQFLLQGHDFSGWRRGSPESTLDEIARRPARANLELSAVVENGAVRATANGHVADPALSKVSTIVIAYADSGLSSEVKAGENRGVRLTHDHVVRALAKGRAGDLEAKASFTRPSEAGSAPTLVAFVQSSANNDVLQAVALPLAGCSP